MRSTLLRTAAAAAATLAVTAAVATATATAGPGAGVYVVRAGDTLTRIAATYSVTLAALARANRLDPAKPLLIGVKLTVPAPWCPGETLVVRAGDSLWTIAARYGVGRARLASVNGLKPDALLILGAKLRIPARPCPDSGSATPGVTATATPATPATPAATTTVGTSNPPGPAPAGPGLSASALQSLRARLAAAASDPALPPSLTGVAVIDLHSGQTVYEQNAGTPLAPASTEKLPLLVAALGLLGPSFHAHTDVLTAAPVAGSVLRGDIVLKGYGDPRLSLDGIAGLAGTVRSLGVTSITGSVVADESAFDTQRIGPGWKPEFLGEESPPLSALVVAGLAGPDGPAASAAILFTKALQGAGIQVAGGSKVGVAAPGARVLASIQGPSLAELAAAMGTWSDNYVAETTLKALGLHVAGAGTSAAGAGVVAQRLATLGVPHAGVVIADGSGLSSLDRIPARTLAALLAAAGRDASVGPTLKESLSLGGVTGTLRRRLRTGAAAGIVRAKTGTTDPASALAGYVGDRFAFAIISNVAGAAAIDQFAAHALQDRVVEALAESLR